MYTRWDRRGGRIAVEDKVVEEIRRNVAGEIALMTGRIFSLLGR
jgi:hypothetical protein